MGLIESILNRLRGTGIIFNISKFQVTGAQLYAIYLGIIVTIFSSPGLWYLGLIVPVVFLIGEGMTWGKWVGYLTEDGAPENISNPKGTSFPYISQTAELFFKQTENYKRYCQTALIIRGLYWWTPVLACFYFAGITTLSGFLIGSVILGISFPVACYISKYVGFTKTYGVLAFSRGWENQEFIYGFIQGIIIWTLIIFGF